MVEALSNLEQSRKDPLATPRLQQLMGQSKFNRSDRNNPDTTIEFEGQKYTIEMVPDGQSETLSGVQNLFTKTFGAAEVDPEEILRNAVDGKNPWGGTDAVKYRVHVIKDSKGEVVSTVAGGRLDLKYNKNPSGKQMFMVAYAVTDENMRESGLAREAYTSAIMQAAKEAQAEGKELGFAAGECTFTSEKFWNSIGWKRPYAKMPGKNELEELKYVQPALDFDEKTGAVSEGSGIAPEHLMIDSFGKNPPNKDDILATVRAFYEWCNTWPQEAFETLEALQQHQKHVLEIWDKFKEQVSQSEALQYMSKDEREKALAAGQHIIEHSAADHGNAGEEDF